MTLVKLLNVLSSFLCEGDDILNERLWRIINYIVHKPELSTRYLTLHQNENTKKSVYLEYYKFIIAVLSKIIIGLIGRQTRQSYRKIPDVMQRLSQMK